MTIAQIKVLEDPVEGFAEGVKQRAQDRSSEQRDKTNREIAADTTAATTTAALDFPTVGGV
jgi:hypothetical protein